MATDATGTPTSPDSIPTYNTAVDAPSGKGFNAAMAAIQTALSNRVSTPAGILTGELPVWSGTAWIRSSQLSGNNLSKFARGDGTWSALAPYRKITTKTDSNSVAQVDLLNNEVTIAAGVMGTSGAVRVTAFGNIVNNTGATQRIPSFQVQLGATRLCDTSSPAGNVWAIGSGLSSWRAEFLILNSATNAQAITLKLDLDGSLATGIVTWATGNGRYSSDGNTDFASAVGYNTTAVDTTVANLLQFQTQLSAASASLSVSLLGATVELI